LEAGLLLTGLGITVKVAVWSLLLGILVGIVAGSMRLAPRPVLRWMARIYVELIRNSPPIVFIFVFYFFISSQIMPLLGIGDAAGHLSGVPRLLVTVLVAPPDQLDSFLSGVVCLGLFSGAYITEIMRAGIASVGINQIEAARALGLGRWAVFRKVVLPQALQRMLPALGGQFIVSIKDSAFVSLISIPDLTFATSEVSDTTHRFFEVWLFAAFLYFVVCFSCALAFRRLEYRARERRA
jgi:polar amino acid transport system permease protein